MKRFRIVTLLLGMIFLLPALQNAVANGLHMQMRAMDSNGQAFTAYRWTWFDDWGWETDTGHTIVFDPFFKAWAYATLEPGGRLRSSGVLVGRIAPDKLDMPLHLRPLKGAATPAGNPEPAQMSAPMSMDSNLDVPPSCLGEGGSISGTVRDASGAPIAGADVWATRWAGWGYAESDWGWAPDGWKTQTDVLGRYSLPVYPGFYEVWAGGAGLASEFHDKQITVTPGTGAGPVDITLLNEGTVSGQITTDDDQALPSASVTIHRWNTSIEWWDTLSSLNTDADGKYLFDKLNPGHYAFCFSAPGYIDECYQDAPDLISSRAVSVAPGSNTTDIDAGLALGGSLSGTVYGPDGDPVSEYIGVDLFDANGCCFEIYDSVMDTYVYEDGTYRFEGLAPGEYFVRFDGQESYTSEWYDDASDHTGATKVRITSGQETANIDAQLAASGSAPGTGSISGKVTDDQGKPITDSFVSVTAYEWVEYDDEGAWSWADNAMVYPDGGYVIYDLPEGNYRVCFNADAAYKNQCYNNQPDVDSATDILVTEGIETTGIDAALHRWTTTISGRLTDRSTNIPIQGAFFGISTEQGDWQTSAWTDVCGNYSAYYDSGTSFAAWIHQSHNSDLWPNLYYGDTLLFDQATMISIPSGQTTKVLDIDIPRAGSISGTVRDAAGRPVKNAEVFTGYDCCSNHICDLWPGARTNADGSYLQTGLLAGTYHVRTRGADDDIWRHDVIVSAGETTPGIDLTLDTGSGTGTGTNVCRVDNAMISGTYDVGRHVIEGAGRLTSQGLVIVRSGTEFRIRSRRRITLNPGFQVRSGASLIAEIGPVTCP